MVEFHTIAHLVARAEPRGGTLHCTFRCPETALEEQSTVSFEELESRQSQEPDPVRSSSPFGRVRAALLGVVESMFGGEEKQLDEELEEREQQELTCRAFSKVRAQFRMKNGLWIHREVDDRLVDFRRQMKAFPVVESYDQEVLARVLMEIVKADGQIDDSERRFLAPFVPEHLTDLEQAAPITVAELSVTSASEVRSTILLVAWAAAFADEKVDQRELQRLAAFGKGFMLPEKRVRELRYSACLFVLDRALAELYANPPVDAAKRDEIYLLAQKMEVDRKEVEGMESGLMDTQN